MARERESEERITHTSRPGEDRGDGFTGGEKLSEREEFAGRTNRTRERREQAEEVETGTVRERPGEARR